MPIRTELIDAGPRLKAANDFASLLARVRLGAEVIIEHDAQPVAVVRPAEIFRGRLLSESLALAEAHAKELGYAPTKDPECVADLRRLSTAAKQLVHLQSNEGYADTAVKKGPSSRTQHCRLLFPSQRKMGDRG